MRSNYIATLARLSLALTIAVTVPAIALTSCSPAGDSNETADEAGADLARRARRKPTNAAATPTNVAATPTIGGIPTKTARSVREFLDSVGVNTHWNYGDTPYGAAYGRVSQLIIDAGVRHMRAGCDDAAVLDMWKRAGVQSTVSFEPDYGTIGAQLECVKSTNSHGAAIVSIEQPNEPDLFWAPRQTKTYRGAGFPDGPKAFSCDVYAAAKADPTTAGLPIIGMSFGVTYGSAPAPYGDGELAPCADWGNHHTYAGGEPFSSQFAYGGLDWYWNDANNPGGNIAEQQHYLSKIRAQFAPKAMAATETGYSTYKGSVTEEIQAIYMPRLWLEHFRVGFKRTFAYEFVDAFPDPGGADRESHFGLVRNDLTPKPAYVAVSSFLTRLRATEAEPAVTSTLGEVQITVSPPPGYSRTELVRSLLLKRGNGGYALILWHEISAQDRETLRRLQHPAIGVSLKVDVPAAKVERYAFDPAWNFVKMSESASVTTLDVEVDERPSVFFLR